MQYHRLGDFTRGWLVGNFDPALIHTKNFELAIQYLTKGEEPRPHFHKRSREFTVIVKGKIEINGTVFIEGEIFCINSFEVSEPKILEDSIVVVFRDRSDPEDKYYIES